MNAVRGYFRRRPHLVAGLDGTGVEALVEDVVGDALLSIRTNLDRFRGESRFTTWAFQIAINRAAREARRRRWLSQSLEAPAAGEESPTLEQLLEGNGAIDPEAELARDEIWAAIEETIDHDLTPRQRRALLGAMLEGQPLEQVARELDTNRNALYKLLHDARSKLRRGMERRGWSRQTILAHLEAMSGKTETIGGP